MEVAEALMAPPQLRPAEADAWAKFDPSVPAEVKDKLSGKKPTRTLRVLTCNWNAVLVFQLCRFERLVLSGLEKARVLFTGITACEIEAVSRAHSLTFDTDLLARVRIMEQAACAKLNE